MLFLVSVAAKLLAFLNLVFYQIKVVTQAAGRNWQLINSNCFYNGKKYTTFQNCLVLGHFVDLPFRQKSQKDLIYKTKP